MLLVGISFLIIYNSMLGFDDSVFCKKILYIVQRAVLEPAMQGRDMIGRAKTGTGKTLAFGIPIMDRIIQYNDKHGFVCSLY